MKFFGPAVTLFFLGNWMMTDSFAHAMANTILTGGALFLLCVIAAVCTILFGGEAPEKD